MAGKKQAHVPSMSNEAVKARTGKDWASWFAVLDKAGAAKLDHRSIVNFLSKEHGIPGWWAQTVTVEYERARGRRARHETSNGFAVGVSKTVATSLPRLYSATANAATRKKWFPKGTFEVSSQTKDKYFNGAWNKDSRLVIGFYARGDHKSQIALQVNKLAKKSNVEVQRKAWKEALSKLQDMLEK